MEHRGENTLHDLSKLGKTFESLWRMLWAEVEDKWSLAFSTSSIQASVSSNTYLRTHEGVIWSLQEETA